MVRPKIIRSYSRLTDGKLLEKVALIMSSITGNASFATPDPTIEIIQASYDSFSTILADAQKGDRYKIAKKNDAKAALILLLDDLAAYVTKIAKGNRTVLLTSGFDITKEEYEKISSLGEVNNYRVNEGTNAGELISECSSVESARSYNHQVTADPVTADSTWKNYPTTNSSLTIKGLSSGKRYWCRIEAIGSNGQLSYSEPVSRIVQ